MPSSNPWATLLVTSKDCQNPLDPRMPPIRLSGGSRAHRYSRAFSIHISTLQHRARRLLLPPLRRRPVAGDPGKEKATCHPGFSRAESKMPCPCAHRLASPPRVSPPHDFLPRPVALPSRPHIRPRRRTQIRRRNQLLQSRRSWVSPSTGPAAKSTTTSTRARSTAPSPTSRPRPWLMPRRPSGAPFPPPASRSLTWARLNEDVNGSNIQVNSSGPDHRARRRHALRPPTIPSASSTTPTAPSSTPSSAPPPASPTPARTTASTSGWTTSTPTPPSPTASSSSTASAPPTPTFSR